MKPFYFFIGLIIVIPVACRNEIVKTKVSEAIRVKTDSVIPETLSIPVNSSGILCPAEELKLSFKTGGVVAGIYVREGERVKKGEILATLNLSEIDAQVNLARNGYEKATQRLYTCK